MAANEDKPLFVHSPFLNERGKNFEWLVLREFGCWYKLWDRSIRLAYELRLRWEHDATNHIELYAAVLYTRLLEVIESIALLTLRGLSHVADATVRMALETLFRLKAACHNPVLAEELMYQHLRERKNILKALLRSKTENIKSHADELRALLKDLNNEIRSRDVRRISIETLAREVDSERLYEIVYRETSRSTHSSLDSLEDYLELDSLGRVKAIVSGPRTDMIAMQLQAATEFLLIGMDHVRKKWALGGDDQFHEISSEFRRLVADQDQANP